MTTMLCIDRAIDTEAAGDPLDGRRFEGEGERADWLDEARRLLGTTSVPPADRRRLEELITRAGDVIAAQRDEIQRLAGLTLVDELTGIYNWRGFNWQLRSALDEFRRTGQGGVLIYVDLDEFKAINDGYGHAAGNAVLVEVAAALKASIRSHDAVGRIGGDEFAALMVRTSGAQGRQRATDLERAVGELRTTFGGRALSVRASAGVVPFAAGDSSASLLARADRRMYANKRARHRGRPGRLQRDPHPAGAEL